MTSTKTGSSEPIGKVIGSLQVLAVLAFGFLFWFTCTRIESPDLKSVAFNAQDASERYSTDQVFADVAALKPSQLQEQGKPKEALAEATQLFADHPYDVPDLMSAGNVLSQAQDPETAKEGFRILRRSIYLAPNSRWVRLNYARQLCAAKRYEEAIPQYELLFDSANVQWTAPHYELAHLYMDEKQFDKAAEQLHYALQYDTKRGLTYRQMALATAAAAAGDSDNDGFDEFKKGVGLEQNAERGPLQHCPGEVEALVVQNDKDPAKALFKVQNQLKATPDDNDLKVEAARLFLAINRLDDAKAALADLEKNDNEDSDVYETKAQLLLMQNNEAAAKEAFGQAVKLTREGS